MAVHDNFLQLANNEDLTAGTWTDLGALGITALGSVGIRARASLTAPIDLTLGGFQARNLTLSILFPTLPAGGSATAFGISLASYGNGGDPLTDTGRVTVWSNADIGSVAAPVLAAQRANRIEYQIGLVPSVLTVARYLRLIYWMDLGATTAPSAGRITAIIGNTEILPQGWLLRDAVN